MTGTKVASQRTLVIKPGMTPEDVKKAPNATLEQKAMAHIFDADGKDGFSQREAEVFNATSITNNGKNGVSLWTTYADGTKKETKVAGDLTAFKYAPSGDVKKIGNTENPVSKDKKISLNMTYQDAYKSGNLEAFALADLNGDKKIDEGEFKRYQGSCIKYGDDGKKFSPERRFSSSLYPGQKFEDIKVPYKLDTRNMNVRFSQVSLSKMQDAFRFIDTNKDGVISEEEIKVAIEKDQEAVDKSWFNKKGPLGEEFIRTILPDGYNNYKK